MSAVPLTPALSRRERGTQRRGVTLLEVLISMFVLLVGLAGMAALLPAGRFLIAEAGKADRSGAVGRAALREIKVRDMLNPRMWVHCMGVNQWTRAGDPSLPGDLMLGQKQGANPLYYNNIGQSFAIDPLFVATAAWQNDRNANYRHFPCVGTAVMPRISLANASYPWTLPSGTNLSGLSLPAASRIFRSDDDLLFDIPTDRDYRPRPMMACQMGNSGGALAYPVRPSDNVSNQSARPLALMSAGAYSWMVTVSPAVAESQPAVPVPYSGSQLYMVSVVVFHQRDFTMPGNGVTKPCERPVALTAKDLTGFGWGGGSLTLRLPSGQSADYLEVDPGEWLIIGAMHPSGFAVWKWYKVVTSNADEASKSQTRSLTLSGPDWNDLAILYTQPTVVLVTRVVGVYTCSTNLNLSPNWAQ